MNEIKELKPEIVLLCTEPYSFNENDISFLINFIIFNNENERISIRITKYKNYYC